MYCQHWSSITFKRFKIEASAMEMLYRKELSKNVWHGSVAPRGVPKCQICCVLGLSFVHSHFSHLHTLPVLFIHLRSPISAYPSPSPRRWTRNLATADKMRSGAARCFVSVISFTTIRRPREFPTAPSGGLIPPTFAHTLSPRLQGEMRERGKGREGEREKERRREGTPRVGWHPPMFRNPEKYPASTASSASDLTLSTLFCSVFVVCRRACCRLR